MAASFNLTAQINLRGPTNVKQVVSGIKKQLGSISAAVNLQINPQSVTNVNKLNNALKALNATLATTATNSTNAATAINQLQAAIRGAGNPAFVNQLNNFNKAAVQVNQTLPNINRNINASNDSMRSFGRQAGASARRLTALGAATGAIYGLGNAINKSLKEFTEYNKQIVRLSQVTGKTVGELSNFTSTITQLSTTLGTSSLELSKISVTLAQAGISARDTEKALRALALTDLTPTFSSLNDTVEGSIALMKQFSISTGELESALGSINAVAASFAVESGDIIKAIQRTGGVFASASKGVSEGTDALNEFIAIFTSVRATTRESAETIATGLRTIFTRIQRGSTIEALKEFGVTLTDAEGKFVGAYRAIQLLSEGLSRIDPRDVKFSDIVEELGGFRQIGKVIPLIQQFATAQDALRVAQQGQGSLATDAAKGQLALAVQIQKVREEFNALIRSIGQSSSFQTFVKAGLDLASALIKVADATKGLLPLIGIFAAFKGIRAATTFFGGFGEGLVGGKQKRRFASGGLVPGTGSTDSVHAMLTPGEFVVRKGAVKSIGAGRLNRINKYPTGGTVESGAAAYNVIGASYVPEEKSYTFRKEPSAKFTRKTRFNAKDTINYNLQEKNINVRRYYPKVNGEENQDPIYQKYIQEKDSSKRGKIFEKIAEAKIVGYTRSRNPSSYLDGNIGDTLVEIKSKTSTSERELGKKLLAAAIAGNRGSREKTDQKAGTRLRSLRLTDQPEALNLGDLTLINDITPNVETYVKKKGKKVIDPVTGEALRQKVKLGKIQRSRPAKVTNAALGGFIQKFMAGGVSDTSSEYLESLMQRIKDVGGAAFVARQSGITDIVQRNNLQKKTLNGVNIKMGRDIDVVLKYLTKAEQAKGLNVQKAQKEFEEARKDTFKVQIAGVLPVGHKFDQVYDIGDRKVNLVARGLDEKYRAAVERMQAAASNLATDFGTDIQKTYGEQPNLRSVSPEQDIVFGQGNIEGAVIEKVLYQLGATLIPGSKQNRTIDYMNGLGDSAKYFTGLSSTDPTEVKRIINGDSLYDTRQKIAKGFADNLFASGGIVQKLMAGGYSKPASPKQLEFLKSLVATNGVPEGFEYPPKTSAQASALIDRIKNPPKQGLDLNSLFQEYQQIFGMVHPQAKEALEEQEIKDWTQNIDRTIEKYNKYANVIKEYYGKIIQQDSWNGSFYAYGGVTPSTKKRAELDQFVQGGGFDRKLLEEFGRRGDLAFGSRVNAPRGPGANSSALKTRKTYMRGYAAGGTVPAMVSNGEAFVPPAMAKSIGYSRLHKMNRADKNGMSSFASGGISVFKGAGNGTSDSIGPVNLPVGSFIIREKATKALGLHKGGVARFAAGGSVNPDLAGVSNLQALGITSVTRATSQSLQSIIQTLRQLGVEGSNSARILNDSRRSTLLSANQAMKADYELARAAGASAEVLQELSDQIKETARQQEKEIEIKRIIQRAGASGETLQQVISSADKEFQTAQEKQRTNLRATGLSEDEIAAKLKEQAGAQRQKAFETEAKARGLDFTGLNLAGQDLENAINGLMRDSKILEQMNAQYRRDREKDLKAEGLSKKQINKIINEEIKARKDAITQLSESEGIVSGDQQGIGGQRSFYAAAGIVGIGTAISSMVDSQKSAFNASLVASTQAASMALGTVISVTGQLNEFAGELKKSSSAFTRASGKLLGFTSKVAGAAGTVFALTSAIISGINAWRDFEKNLRSNKIETSLQTLNGEFERIGEDLSKFDVNLVNSLLYDSANTFNKMTDDIASKGRLSFNLLLDWAETLLGYRSEETFGKQGEIERISGADAAARAGSSAELLRSEYGMIIPQLAREQAEAARSIAEGIKRSFEFQFKQGSSIQDIMSQANFSDFAETLATANAVIRQQILELENSGLDPAQISNLRSQIVQQYAREQLVLQQSIVTREKEINSAQQFAQVFTLSLKRSFDNLSQVVNAVSANMQSLQRDIELVSSAYAGQAKVLNTTIQTINVLENPRAYNTGQVATARGQAQTFLGGSQLSNLIGPLLQSGDVAENTIMSTINSTLRANAGATDELIGREITKQLKQELDNIGLPPELVGILAREIGKQVQKLRSEGEDQISFSQLQDKVAGLSQTMEYAQMAQAGAVQALGLFNTALNNYEQNSNRIIELEISRRNRLRKADDIVIDAAQELAKALNKTVSLETIRQRLQTRVADLTGGQTDPREIFNNIRDITRQVRIDEDIRQGAANRGPTGADDFIKFTNEVQRSSIALRENYNALELLAENTNLASAAMSRIQEQQQKIAGRVSFIEKLVTATPDDLDNLNQSFIRLQNNINGQVNTIQNSVGAQKAYQEAMQNGASGLEAMRAAQTAFAEERRGTLGLLQELLPFLGDAREANNIRANVLESMLRESGVGLNPMMLSILNTLRNPEIDPEVAKAIAFYEEATGLQAEANRYLAKLDGELASDIANKNANAIADALRDIEFKFVNAELTDIARGINTLVDTQRQPATRASGGIIYASAGQMVDFSPQGSDTVPAMLTPGEFVVNRQATQKHRGLLENINSNKYSRGGSVRYYATGGFVSDLGNPSELTDSNTQTKLKLIDPDHFTDADLTKSTNTNFWKLPGSYAIINPVNAVQNQVPDRQGQNTAALRRILPTNGDVVPGLAPQIKMNGLTDYDYVKPEDPEALLNNTVPFKDTTSFLYPSLDSIPTRNIRKLEWEEYKTKFSNDLLNKAKFDFDPADFTDNPPSVRDIVNNAPAGNVLTLSASKNPLGVMSTTPTYTEATDRAQYRIWDEENGGGHAVSKGEPTFDGSDSSWKKRTAGIRPIDFQYVDNYENSNEFLSAKKLKDIKTNIDDNYKAYQRTGTYLLDPRIPNDPFYWDDTGNDLAAQNVRENLKKLHDRRILHYQIQDRSVITRFFEKIKPEGLSSTALLMGNNNSQKDIVDQMLGYYRNNPRVAERSKVFISSPFVPAGAALDFAEKEDFELFELDANARQLQRTGGFGYVSNYDLSTLDEDTQEELQRGLRARHPSEVKLTDLAAEEVNLANILPGIDLPVKVQYQQWEGKLYDPVTDDYPGQKVKIKLPNSTDGTLFKELDTSRKRLVSADLKKFSANKLKNVVAANFQRQNIATALQDFINFQLGDQTKAASEGVLRNSMKAVFNDYFWKNDIESQDSGLEILSDPMANGRIRFNIGEHIVEQLKQRISQNAAGADKLTDKARDFKRLSVGDNELPRVITSVISGGLETLGRVTLPGLGFGWLGGQIGGLPTLLKNRPDLAKNAAAASSNVFGQLAAYLVKIGNTANTPQAYQYMKEIFTVASGASSILGGLASGNTNFIAQIIKGGFNTNWQTLFRSAGAGLLVNRLIGENLPQDLQNALANDLQGGLIKTVGPNGALSQGLPMENALPTTWKDLSDLALNPYNEFPATDTRAKLIQRLGIGLTRARGPFGLPYFDQNTNQFIWDRLSQLHRWYGGAGPWKGQDYLTDKNADPNHAARTANFIASLPASNYAQANQSHVELGLGNKYGPLPEKEYFTARIAKGFQTGGVVYAESGGQMVNFQPRGTDTVPAMLTPGEFVINRKATQENLPLLKAINSGSKAYSSGGVVYAAYGGQMDESGGGGPSNKREALIQGEKQADITKAVDRPIYEKRLKEYIQFKEQAAKVYGETAFGLNTFANQVMNLPNYTQQEKLAFLKSSLLPMIEQSRERQKSTLEDIRRLKGGGAATNELDQASLALALAGLSPIGGIFADLLSIPVDLARGDIFGAGLSALATLPFLGVPAGLKKAERLTEMQTGFKEVFDKLEAAVGAQGGTLGFLKNKTFQPVTTQHIMKFLSEERSLSDLDGFLRRIAIQDPDKTMIKPLHQISKKQPFGPFAFGRDMYKELNVKFSEALQELQTFKQMGGASDTAKAADVGGSATKAGSAAGPTIKAGSAASTAGSTTKAGSAAGPTIKAGSAAGPTTKTTAAPDTSSLKQTVQEARDFVKRHKLLTSGVLFGGGSLTWVVGALIGNFMRRRNLSQSAPISIPNDRRPRIPEDQAGQGAGQGGQGGNQGGQGGNQGGQEGTVTDRNIERLRNLRPGESYLQTETIPEEERKKQNFSDEDKKLLGIPLSKGGVVYASGGMLVPYRPQGTDTVPAMLTPGEFVVNRAATQANLPLLKSINSGGYAKGGVVYLQDGSGTHFPDSTGPIQSENQRIASVRAQQTRQKEEDWNRMSKADRIEALTNHFFQNGSSSGVLPYQRSFYEANKQVVDAAARAKIEERKTLRGLGIDYDDRVKIIENIYRTATALNGQIGPNKPYSYRLNDGRTNRLSISGFAATNKKAMRYNVPYTDYQEGKLVFAGEDGNVRGSTSLKDLDTSSLRQVLTVLNDSQKSQQEKVDEALAGADVRPSRYGLNTSTPAGRAVSNFVSFTDRLEKDIYSRAFGLQNGATGKFEEFDFSVGQLTTRDKFGGYLKTDFDRFLEDAYKNNPAFITQNRKALDESFANIYDQSASALQTGYEKSQLQQEIDRERARMDKAAEAETVRVGIRERDDILKNRQALMKAIYDAGMRLTKEDLIDAGKNRINDLMLFRSNAEAEKILTGHIYGLHNEPQMTNGRLDYSSVGLDIAKYVDQPGEFSLPKFTGKVKGRLGLFDTATLQNTKEYLEDIYRNKRSQESGTKDLATKDLVARNRLMETVYGIGKGLDYKEIQSVITDKDEPISFNTRDKRSFMANVYELVPGLLNYKNGNMDYSDVGLSISRLTRTATGETKPVADGVKLGDLDQATLQNLVTFFDDMRSRVGEKLIRERSQARQNQEKNQLGEEWAQNQEELKRLGLNEELAWNPLGRNKQGKFEPYKLDMSVSPSLQRFFIKDKGYPVYLKFNETMMDAVRRNMAPYENESVSLPIPFTDWQINQKTINDLLLGSGGTGSIDAEYEDGTRVNWLGEEGIGPLIPYASVLGGKVLFRQMKKLAPIANAKGRNAWENFNKWKAQRRTATATKASDEARAADAARKAADEARAADAARKASDEARAADAARKAADEARAADAARKAADEARAADAARKASDEARAADAARKAGSVSSWKVKGLDDYNTKMLKGLHKDLGFPDDIIPGQWDRAAAAYKKSLMNTHPDRVKFTGLTVEEANRLTNKLIKNKSEVIRKWNNYIEKGMFEGIDPTLLRAGTFSRGGIVYARNGRRVPNQGPNKGYNLAKREERLESVNNVISKLSPYTSGKAGMEKFAKLFGAAAQNTSLGIGPSYYNNQLMSAQTLTDPVSGASRIVIPQPYVSESLINHELGHVIQFAPGVRHTGVDNNVIPWIQNYVNYLNNNKIKPDHLRPAAGGISMYTPQQLLNQPIEIFPSILQLMTQDPQAFQDTNGPKALKASMKAMGFNKGGMVYANNGMLVPYEPRGTDTVPAMLTPGEFVVNRRSTQMNLPLLQAINNGGAAGMSLGGIMKHFSSGGAVSYLASGTPGTAELMNSVTLLATIFNNAGDQIGDALSTITSFFENFARNTPNTNNTNFNANNNNGVSNNTNPVDVIQSLGQKLDNFIQQLQQAIPDVIKVEGNHRVDVVINGAQALQSLLSGPLQNLVASEIQKAFNEQSRQREGS